MTGGQSIDEDVNLSKESVQAGLVARFEVLVGPRAVLVTCPLEDAPADLLWCTFSCLE